MGTVNLFTGSSGLKTKVDKTRVRFDPETGVSDLVVGVNVTHDETGLLNRRKGSTILTPGDFHSLFAGGGECYTGHTNELYRVNDDFSLTPVRDQMSGNRIDFTVTPKGIYYMNGFDFGYLKEGHSFLWKKDEYVGPETSRSFSGPPVGQHIELFGALMLIAKGNVLYRSRPLSYGSYEVSKDFNMFPSRIRMIKAVGNGVYISDNDRTYFLAGHDPREWRKDVVSGYPIIEWSDNHGLVNAKELGIDIKDANCALWVDEGLGACIGTSDGQIHSLNPDNRVVYPKDMEQGSSLLMGDKFIHSMW